MADVTDKPGKIVKDPELKAISVIVNAVESLDEKTRQRVLDYLKKRYFTETPK